MKLSTILAAIVLPLAVVADDGTTTLTSTSTMVRTVTLERGEPTASASVTPADSTPSASDQSQPVASASPEEQEDDGNNNNNNSAASRLGPVTFAGVAAMVAAALM